MDSLRGSLRALALYDVSEEIALDRVRSLLGITDVRREPSFRSPSPDYVRFDRPPVIETAEPMAGSAGSWNCVVKYYSYGVISVALERPFETGWGGLVQLSSEWMGSGAVERRAGEIARSRAERVRGALINPNDDWTAEDYYAVHLREAPDETGAPMTARRLLTEHAPEIAQIVRGESAPLSDEESREVLQTSISYYPTDLLVVTWGAALVYDTPEGAAPTLQLLEYANTQLLEFRYYDNVLTNVLEGAYRTLEHKGGLWSRWRAARKAERLNRIRLDVRALTERVDNSIKFLSDMFYARAYRLAAEKIGVTDYRLLVEEKLRTAGDYYQSMVNEFHQERAFWLEAMVVAILIIELVFLFRGK